MNENLAPQTHPLKVTWENFMFFIIIFLVTSNKLAPFPIEKVAIILFLGVVLYKESATFFLKRYEFELLTCMLIICCLSFFINFFESTNAIIFFPLIGCIFCYVLARREKFIHILYYALLFHFLLALIFFILSYLIGFTRFSEDMTYKGLPFIHVIKGFTPTIQVFGSLCLAWFLIYYYSIDKGLISSSHKGYFYFVALCLFLTLNRTTFLGFGIILYFREKKFFYFLMACAGGLVLVFYKFLILTFFNLSTLDARSELLDGFNKSFWGSYSPLIYIFGRGNNQIGPAILQTVKWDFRKDIENGYAMILNTYGFTGLFFYLIAALLFMYFTRKNWLMLWMTLFFLLVQPYFTQEYMATSFYISIAAVLFISRNNTKITC